MILESCEVISDHLSACKNYDFNISLYIFGVLLFLSFFCFITNALIESFSTSIKIFTFVIIISSTILQFYLTAKGIYNEQKWEYKHQLQQTNGVYIVETSKLIEKTGF